jgi:hypothetical protein
MDKQIETSVIANESAVLRELLDSELVFIGGGELVLLGG